MRQANQRAPRSGLQLKQCYEGRHVHGVRPRGAMVGSGKGAGRECVTTGVVGHCRNTGWWVGTGETKRNKCGVQLTEYLSTRKAIYILRRTRRPCGTYESGMRQCAIAGRLGARPSDASGLRSWCQNVSVTLLLALDLHPNVAGIGTLQRHNEGLRMGSVKNNHVMTESDEPVQIDNEMMTMLWH